MNPKQRDALKELQNKYIEDLPEKIEIIKRLLESAKSLASEDTSLPQTKINGTELIQQEFHKLKGTGKTYGFPDVTKIASCIDQHFKNSHPQFLILADKACDLLLNLFKHYKNQQNFILTSEPLFKEIQ